MIDSGDPYPLQPGITDREAMSYSEQVDAWLGFSLADTERAIRERLGESRLGDAQEYWVGLNIQSLLTPYTEIRELLERLRPGPGETVVDLGAGYGRIGFVLGRYYPGVRFVGYEFVAERVREASRCLATFAYPGIEMRQVDLSAPGFRPEPADFYFLYDYGTRPAVEKTLEDLREIASARGITVVGRGRLSRDAIERHHPWLSQVVAPEHFRNYSVYRSKESLRR
jgi:hypothetical protein